jgi:hypothetical protein
MAVTYYHDIESEAIYACVGAMAGEPLFVMREPPAGAWAFLVPDSPEWDAAHQGIFRNARVAAVTPETAAALPPLPPIPSGPFPEWKEHFLPREPISTAKYPRIARFFAAGRHEQVTLCVVLYEDTYETSFGDGEFHYFRDVFDAREDAERVMAGKRGEWERLHLRTMSVRLDRGAFVFTDFAPQLYDRYKPEEVLVAWEARLDR